MTERLAYRLESTARPGQRIEELDTPALIVDLDRMERNIARFQALADANAIRLRPHIKTHKVPAIARLQLDAGAVGIACAKTAEAEVFVDAGFEDVVVAYPVFGEAKWRRLAALASRARIALNVDSVEAVEGAAAAARQAGATLGMWLDVDTGLHRGGVAHDDRDEIRRVADAIERSSGAEPAGLTTHRQIFFAEIGGMTPEQAGRDEVRILGEIADELRGFGFAVPEIAAGGSICHAGAAAAPGITELRAGTYVFCDLMEIGLGVAGWDDLALSVLCTVVSTRQPGGATIDGGSKTFSGDRGLVGSPVAGLDGLAVAVGRDMHVDRFTEEHGMVAVGAGETVALGEKLRFYPTHACTAVNLSDQLIGCRGEVVEVVWPVLARGKRT
jgi:D-serine deaminase-like pyridoxal phosphate-dependent protein